MATEVPFGLTFGNPSKYMGSSNVGQAVKTGLTAYAMQKSGLKGWLDDLGKKTPEGSIPPITSGAAGDMNTNGIWGTNPLPVQPPNFGGQTSEATPEVNPNAGAFTEQAQNQFNLNKSMIPNSNGIAGAVTPGVQVTPVIDNFPSDIGHQILDGNDSWQGSSVDPQAQRDSLVLPQQQTAEAPRLTGNEYQQAPGYGSAKKMAMAMFGLG